MTALDATDAANLTVDVGTGKEYTLGKEFSNIKSGNNSFKVTASGNYKVNGTTITLANITGVEIGDVNYSVDTENISKTLSVNTYHLTKSDTVTTSALTSYDNWKLHSGSVTYDVKTYKHTLALPTGATATGDKLVIDDKDYYATGTTVTVSGFTSGEISFDFGSVDFAQ